MKSIAFAFLRFSSQFDPTPEAFAILEKAVRYLLYGKANVAVEEASWGRSGNLIVVFNSSGWRDHNCSAPRLVEISVNGRPENFTQNYFKVLQTYPSGSGGTGGNGNGYARYRFSARVDSKWLGNLSVSFRDSCGHSGRFRVVRTNGRRSRILMVVNDDRRSLLRSSIYGYPVISYDHSGFRRKWVERAVRKIRPITVMCVDAEPLRVGEWPEQCDFFIDSESLKYQFDRIGNGGVLLGNDSVLEIYGASYAAKEGKYLIFRDEFSGNPVFFNGTCFDRDCIDIRIDRLGMKEDLLEFVKGYTGKYVLVNPESDIAAITPLLYLHGYVPLVADGKGNVFSDAGDMNINLSRKTVGIDEAEAIADELYAMRNIHIRLSNPRPEEVKNYPLLLILGLPYVHEQSPIPEWAGKEELVSDRIYRERLYGKYMSRMTSDIQLLPLFADVDENPVLIAASYRQPRYMDAQYTGMDAGFVMDIFLRLKGFNVTRRIEQRMELASLLLDNFDFMSEDAFLEAMIQEVLENLGIANAFNNYMDMKYTLLETDWEKTLSFQPAVLERLNNSKLASDLERTDVFIYFGVGNSTHLRLPPDLSPYERNLITDPYPEGNEVWYGNVSSMVNIIESSHSLAGMENSTGFSELPYVLGLTGKTIDPFSAMNLFSYISAIRNNEPLSSVQWKLWEQVASVDDGSFLSSLLSVPISFMKHQYIATNSVGLPDAGIDPPAEERIYRPVYRDGKWVVEIEEEFNYTIRNGTIDFRNPDFYLMAPGKPAVPVYMFRIDAAGNYSVSFIPEIVEYELKPRMVNLSAMSGNETEGTWGLDWHYVRRRGELILYVIPVKYNLSGTDMFMKSFRARIEIVPEFDIAWRCNGTSLEFMATQDSEISVPMLNFSASYSSSDGWVSVNVSDTGNGNVSFTLYAFNGTTVVERNASCFIAGREEDDGGVENVGGETAAGNFTLPRFGIAKSVRSPEGFVQLLENSFERIEYVISDISEIRYYTPYLHILSRQRPSSMERTMVTPDFRLVLSSNGSVWMARIETPDGWMERRMERGVMREKAHGNVGRLDDAMERAINSLKGNMSYIEFVLSHYG